MIEHHRQACDKCQIGIIVGNDGNDLLDLISYIAFSFTNDTGSANFKVEF